MYQGRHNDQNEIGLRQQKHWKGDWQTEMVKSSTTALLCNEKIFVKNSNCTEQFLQMMKMFWCNENGIAQIELVAQEGCNVFDETVCTLNTQNEI